MSTNGVQIISEDVLKEVSDALYLCQMHLGACPTHTALVILRVVEQAIEKLNPSTSSQT